MKCFTYIVLLLSANLLRAAEPTARPADADLKAIAAQLGSNSSEERQAGISAIREMIQQQPTRALSPFRNTWGKLLLDSREYDAADELALSLILAYPGEPYSIESSLQLRIRAAIAQGRTDAALAHAKSLFNVCSMSSTSNAMLLVAESLSAQSPKDPKRLNQFIAEQIAGAKASETATAMPTTKLYFEHPAYGSSVLASIKVDPEAYLAKARTMFAEDYTSLQSRGNLMLLADRPAEAKELFERAYSVAAPNQLLSATESLARCIKARDGVIGRANTWLLSLRPRPEKSR